MSYPSPSDFPPDDPFPIDDPVDPPLIPGNHGKDCPGNGEHPEHKCCCDHCNYFLFCFPEYWDTNYGMDL